ncbi:MAG: MATE family efflux transporter [Clostridia bacterium]|nr:MATE family efflux transporter [Clostridia bacterium]
MNLLKDDLNKLFFKFLIPAISSAVAVAGYSLVDTIAIGQGVGADGTAACAVVLPIFSIANFIALLCGIGGCVLRSQAKGEGNEEKGNACFTSAVCMVAVITIVVWIVGNLIQNDFYRLCGADEVLMPYAKEYGAWIFAGLPSFVITAFLGAFIRSDGSPKYVMFSTLIGGAVNIVGDWLLVFPLNMGMAGAAIALKFSTSLPCAGQ